MACDANRVHNSDPKFARWMILLMLGLGPLTAGCNQRYVPADYRARLERSSASRKVGMRNTLDTMPAGSTLPGGQTLPLGNSLPFRSTLPAGTRLPGSTTLPARGALPSGNQPSAARPGGNTLPRDSRLPAN